MFFSMEDWMNHTVINIDLTFWVKTKVLKIDQLNTDVKIALEKNITFLYYRGTQWSKTHICSSFIKEKIEVD